MIEVISIGTAGKQIKKPIDIPRPGKKGKGEKGPRRHPDDPGMQQGPEVQQQPRTPALPPSRQQNGGPDPYKQGIAVFQATRFKRR